MYTHQWLNYSEVGGVTLHWSKLQCYTKTIVTETKYAHTLTIYCAPVCQITQIFLEVQECQFDVVERQLDVSERCDTH